MATLKFSGSAMFRQRIIASILSNRPLKIDKIRSENDNTPGLQDFEANFLRLIEKITDGCRIEINETGTILRFRPGMLIGGKITHDCGTSRSIGWFLEAIIPVAPFCKSPLQLSLTGVTNDELDLSVDTLASVTIPLLQNFGIFNSVFKIKQRGAPPNGGGLVEVMIPIVRASLKSVYLTDEGLVKRVRGIAYCTHVSPTIITRVVDSCREVLNNFLPDVYINSDHYTGKKEGGASPGYAVSLVAETSTGVLISTERTAKCRKAQAIPGSESIFGQQHSKTMEVPEDVGREAALALLEEIYAGGVVDSAHQPLVLMLMILTPEDVSKVRFGQLSEQAVQTLRLIKEVFGVTFKITEERHPLPNDNSVDDDDSDAASGGEEDGEMYGMENEDNEMSDDEEGSGANEEESNPEESSESESAHSDDDEERDGVMDSLKWRTTFLLTCLGTGYVNANRRAT